MYSLFGGPNTIYELAEELEHLGRYEVLYRSWSQGVHATGTIKHMGRDKDNPVITGLRDPKNLETYVSLCISMAVEVYRRIIIFYTPQRHTEFAQWYKDNIREWNLKLGSKGRILKVE